MLRLEKIEKIVTDDSITLYWEKIEDFPSTCHYELFVNGKMEGTTDKTHFELEDLSPETIYELRIIGKSSERADAEVLLMSEILKLETGKEKRRIADAYMCNHVEYQRYNY